MKTPSDSFANSPGHGVRVRRRRVTFRLKAADGKEVCVAGTFNDWNPAANRLKFKDGEYRTTLLLPPGRYEYKFVIDGIWCVDPACPDWAPNGFGALNSVMTVA